MRLLNLSSADSAAHERGTKVEGRKDRRKEGEGFSLPKSSNAEVEQEGERLHFHPGRAVVLLPQLAVQGIGFSQVEGSAWLLKALQRAKPRSLGLFSWSESRRNPLTR